MRRAGWWLLAEHVGERLTRPRVDIDASDSRVERLLTESWLLSSVERGAEVIQASWRDSRSRRIASWLVRPLQQADAAARRLAQGWTIATAALTALTLQLAVGRADPAPTWMLPAATGVVGLLIIGTSGRGGTTGRGETSGRGEKARRSGRVDQREAR